MLDQQKAWTATLFPGEMYNRGRDRRVVEGRASEINDALLSSLYIAVQLLRNSLFLCKTSKDNDRAKQNFLLTFRHRASSI